MLACCLKKVAKVVNNCVHREFNSDVAVQSFYYNPCFTLNDYEPIWNFLVVITLFYDTHTWVLQFISPTVKALY